MVRNQYSISEFFSTAISLILTKIRYPGARLIRRPVYIRGKRSMRYGNGLTLGHGCRFDLAGKEETLVIGDACEIGDYVHIVAHNKVIIGNNVLMASKIFISDTSHGVYSGENSDSPYVLPNNRKLSSSFVKIGDRVWVGENTVILPGVTIGDGCIIGANSVVKNDIAPNTIVVGAPARAIKRWNPSTERWERVNQKRI